MSSYPYPAQHRQGAPSYTPQQLAQLQAQQERQRQQFLQKSTNTSYPSPDSTSPSSDGSSPTYSQPSPTLYKSVPASAGQQPTHPHPSSSRSHYPSTSSKEPSWYCMYPAHAGVAFARKADLKRHYDQVHNSDAVRMLDCPAEDCHRRGALGFGRKDKLVEHLREVHKADIPKRVAGEGRRGS